MKQLALSGHLARLLERFRPAEAPRVLVTGMPKSGTTAIARLMGLATGRSVVSDPFHLLDRQGVRFRDELYGGTMSTSDLVEGHPRVFRAVILKDPNFIFFKSEIHALYPSASWVFTVRDPRDNIRSLLNRLKLPGDSRKLVKLPAHVTDTWRRVLEGRTPHLPGATPIEVLAHRWVRSLELCLSGTPAMKISRYEDFVVDKEERIRTLSEECGLTPTNALGKHVDRPFQPRGNRTVSWDEFFSPTDLSRVTEICSGMLREFGYPLDEASS
jgi:hypothetical protein